MNKNGLQVTMNNTDRPDTAIPEVAYTRWVPTGAIN